MKKNLKKLHKKKMLILMNNMRNSLTFRQKITSDGLTHHFNQPIC